jgi:hypothetical protein
MCWKFGPLVSLLHHHTGKVFHLQRPLMDLSARQRVFRSTITYIAVPIGNRCLLGYPPAFQCRTLSVQMPFRALDHHLHLVAAQPICALIWGEVELRRREEACQQPSDTSWSVETRAVVIERSWQVAQWSCALVMVGNRARPLHRHSHIAQPSVLRLYFGSARSEVVLCAQLEASVCNLYSRVPSLEKQTSSARWLPLTSDDIMHS